MSRNAQDQRTDFEGESASEASAQRRQSDRLDESGAALPPSPARRPGTPSVEEDRGLDEKVRRRAYERYLARQRGAEERAGHDRAADWNSAT